MYKLSDLDDFYTDNKINFYKEMEYVIPTAQNYRNAWSFIDTIKYTLIVLQITSHFYLNHCMH